MKKIRCAVATIALVATLSGPLLPLLQGMGAGSMANAAPGVHASSVSSPFVAGQLTRSLAFKPYWPCPAAGADC